MTRGGSDALAQIGDGKAVRNLPRPEIGNTQAVTADFQALRLFRARLPHTYKTGRR